MCTKLNVINTWPPNLTSTELDSLPFKQQESIVLCMVSCLSNLGNSTAEAHKDPLAAVSKGCALPSCDIQFDNDFGGRSICTSSLIVELLVPPGFQDIQSLLVEISDCTN